VILKSRGIGQPQSKNEKMKRDKQFDVIIIGGSYAGLATGMALGRALRNVLIIDGGNPCNRQTPHSHNFLTNDGKPPGEIASLAKKQVKMYESVSFVEGLAVLELEHQVAFKFECKMATLSQPAGWFWQPV
jgi:thioredoxin reductase